MREVHFSFLHTNAMGGNINDNCHMAESIKESWLDVSPGHGQDTSDFWHNSGKLVHKKCLFWDVCAWLLQGGGALFGAWPWPKYL